MKIDLLVAEIGSTTTILNGFDGIKSGNARFVGQGVAPTTVLDGDVRIGIENARRSLEDNMGETVLSDELFATSSAAGGLKMSVHGLVYEMTVNAANAAALGAGAIVKLATAGKLCSYDIDEIRELSPNIIMLAGGTDYGERETALHNAQLIADAHLNVPVIYAGNVQNKSRIERIFSDAGICCYIVDNVYPRIDSLNIEPARKVIHMAFEEHIIKAPGMEHVREAVTGSIIPTPGAVMESCRLMYDVLGDIAVIDIGGATTDIHSVTYGQEQIAAISIGPEPFAKRTVEGDLGLYVNAAHVMRLMDARRESMELGFDCTEVLKELKPIPEGERQMRLAQRLCVTAGKTALERHAGRIRQLFGATGRQKVAEGKDMTLIKYVIGTGGALTRLKDREVLLRQIADCNVSGQMLCPKPGEAELLFDNDYIMASAGVIAKKYPEAAVQLIMNSLYGEKDENSERKGN